MRTVNKRGGKQHTVVDRGQDMNIEIKDQDGQVNVVVNGDIEMMTIKEFKEKLLNIGQTADKDIELDLSNVEYIDSSGIGVLVSLLKLQKKKGKTLKIRKMSSKVMNVLKLSSLSDMFEF
jgi:anti-sigma B factor antagonist